MGNGSNIGKPSNRRPTAPTAKPPDQGGSAPVPGQTGNFQNRRVQNASPAGGSNPAAFGQQAWAAAYLKATTPLKLGPSLLPSGALGDRSARQIDRSRQPSAPGAPQTGRRTAQPVDGHPDSAPAFGTESKAPGATVAAEEQDGADQFDRAEVVGQYLGCNLEEVKGYFTAHLGVKDPENLKFHHETYESEESHTILHLEMKGAGLTELDLTLDIDERDLRIDYAVVDDNHQGKGIMRNALKGIVELAEKTNIASFSLEANISVGIYAWGRYGFYPADNKFRDKLVEQINVLAEGVSDKAHIKRKLNAFCNNDFSVKDADPESFWDIVDLTVEVERNGEQIPLGKAALLDCARQGYQWEGILRLDNEEAVKRLKNYIGYGA